MCIFITWKLIHDSWYIRCSHLFPSILTFWIHPSKLRNWHSYHGLCQISRHGLTRTILLKTAVWTMIATRGVGHETLKTNGSAGHARYWSSNGWVCQRIRGCRVRSWLGWALFYGRGFRHTFRYIYISGTIMVFFNKVFFDNLLIWKNNKLHRVNIGSNGYSKMK